MPQMAPLLWFYLFIYFIMIYFLFLILTFFLKSPSPIKIKPLSTFLTHLIWKW